MTPGFASSLPIIILMSQLSAREELLCRQFSEFTSARCVTLLPSEDRADQKLRLVSAVCS